MVVKNLFTGQQWRNRHRLMDMGRGEEWVRCMDIVTWKPTVKKKSLYDDLNRYKKNI